jgi:uncharacterized membrane protein (UPF0182 family)
LLYSTNNSYVGAGYTDLHARLLSLNLLAFLAVIVAMGFLANAVLRLLWLPLASLGVLVGASLLLGGVYPGIVQRFTVQPNELTMERPYIQRHLDMTRAAYGLDRVEVSPFGQATPMTPANVSRNQPTIQNIRLWDYRPLMDTYNQLQRLRQYYTFPSVAIDRYRHSGETRQVMLAARELDQNSLPAAARLWVNEWLEYTHGYGFVMNPVNAATEDGAPVFWAGDAPQRTSTDLPITRPEIYYGETPGTPVIAPSLTAEFQYTTESETARTRYEGTGGVPIGTYWRRLLFATYFAETNLLLSQAITPDSRIMFNRQIDERAAHIAPFLAFDSDPYLVVADGRLFWIQDAYTTTDHYPYSLPAQDTARNIRRHAFDSLQPDDGSFNYIRNSVKVVTDAYNGAVQFYISDASDPIVGSYQRAFPSLFLPMNRMPASLRAHIRYPEGLFTVQAGLFRSYHVTDPAVLFQQSDRWEFPTEPGKPAEPAPATPDAALQLPLQAPSSNSLPMEPFYVTMRLPDGEGEEFVLILPYQIKQPPSMPAWLCARCDGAHYGHLRAYLFPPGVDGPQQAESYIDQNPDISSKISLWDQKGSKVIRGNLLALLIDQSILYVEPLYLSATATSLPQLKEIILVNARRVVMQPTLGQALQALIGGGAPENENAVAPSLPSPPRPSTGGAGAPAATVSALVNRASQAFDAATKAQRRGDWADYGAKLRQLQQALKELQQRTGALRN